MCFISLEFNACTLGPPMEPNEKAVSRDQAFVQYSQKAENGTVPKVNIMKGTVNLFLLSIPAVTLWNRVL
jgi:hypothetical protein